MSTSEKILIVRQENILKLLLRNNRILINLLDSNLVMNLCQCTLLCHHYHQCCWHYQLLHCCCCSLQMLQKIDDRKNMQSDRARHHYFRRTWKRLMNDCSKCLHHCRWRSSLLSLCCRVTYCDLNNQRKWWGLWMLISQRWLINNVKQ